VLSTLGTLRCRCLGPNCEKHRIAQVASGWALAAVWPVPAQPSASCGFELP
jgi:hypothetical protein